jgi:hypothetical protein
LDRKINASVFMATNLPSEMNAQADKRIYKVAIGIALLLFSCQRSSFPGRKYMPRSAAEQHVLSRADGKCRDPLAGSFPGKNTSGCTAYTGAVLGETADNASPDLCVRHKTLFPVLKTCKGPELNKQEDAGTQILPAIYDHSLKDTTGGKKVQEVKSAKKLGRASLLIPAGSLLLLGVLAALVPETPLLVLFAVIAWVASILGLALGIKSYKTARLNKEKMPLAGKFGIVLSVLGILTPILLLIAFVLLGKGENFSINIPLNLY